MSLATRCSACGTVFRVVQDQLKVSEGWVRCGRCDEVFNALERLFDLERDAPPEWTPQPAATPTPSADIVTARLQTPSLPPDDDEDVLHLSDDDRIHSRFFHSEPGGATGTEAPAAPDRDDVRGAIEPGFGPVIENPDARARRTDTARRKRKKKARPESEDPQSPSFLRAALWRARWESRPVRLALVASALLLSCTLVAQATWHFRDVVAARWPSTRPGLSQACAWAGCRLEFPRRIDDISVESSSLSPANDGAAYKLSVVLRNRNALMPLALPSVDLSLTDTSGQQVARRALSPTDFGLGATPIAPGSETSLQMLLSTEGRRVSGYTVEIFYP